MLARPRSVLLVVCFGLLIASYGCGGQRDVPPTPAEQADAKVSAMKRLADAMAQAPDGPEARAALEDFRNTPLDFRKNPKQADEIVDVYRQRVQGKYSGFVAQEIQTEMSSLLSRPAQK
jgi:hypothetical protein